MIALALDIIQKESAMTALICIVVAAVLWLIRERRLNEERQSVRLLYLLTEAVLPARSPAEIANRLAASLPQRSAAAFHLFLYDRDSGRLVRAGGAAEEPVDTASGGSDNPLLQCYRSGEITVVNDFRDAGEAPVQGGRPALLVPIDAEDRAAGVLAIVYREGPRRFGEDQRAAALHLARHIGFVLRRIQQQAVREQLSRGENVASAARLLASAFNELREPLSSLTLRAENLARALEIEAGRGEFAALAGDARNCLALVDRLASAVGGDGEREVEFRSFVSSLLESHRGEWNAAGLNIKTEIEPAALPVSGSPGQLSEAVRALVGEAVPGDRDAQPRTARLALRRTGDRAILSLSYPSAPDAAAPASEHPSSVVARSIVETHGGHLRRISSGGEAVVVELELPLAGESPETENPEPSAADRAPLTVLVLAPGDSDRRWLVAALANKGHRAVPVSDASEAADLAQRLFFDALFCPAPAPGDPAADTIAKAARFVAGLVLLTDSAQPASQSSSGDLRISTLPRPLDEAQLDRALAYLRRPSGES